jgi:hypothetical protein
MTLDGNERCGSCNSSSQHVWDEMKISCHVGVLKERVNERNESHPVRDVLLCAEEPQQRRIAGPARSARSYL